MKQQKVCRVPSDDDRVGVLGRKALRNVGVSTNRGPQSSPQYMDPYKGLLIFGISHVTILFRSSNH